MPSASIPSRHARPGPLLDSSRRGRLRRAVAVRYGRRRRAGLARRDIVGKRHPGIHSFDQRARGHGGRGRSSGDGGGDRRVGRLSVVDRGGGLELGGGSAAEEAASGCVSAAAAAAAADSPWEVPWDERMEKGMEYKSTRKERGERRGRLQI